MDITLEQARKQNHLLETSTDRNNIANDRWLSDQLMSTPGNDELFIEKCRFLNLTACVDFIIFNELSTYLNYQAPIHCFYCALKTILRHVELECKLIGDFNEKEFMSLMENYVMITQDNLDIHAIALICEITCILGFGNPCSILDVIRSVCDTKNKVALCCIMRAMLKYNIGNDNLDDENIHSYLELAMKGLFCDTLHLHFDSRYVFFDVAHGCILHANGKCNLFKPVINSILQHDAHEYSFELMVFIIIEMGHCDDLLVLDWMINNSVWYKTETPCSLINAFIIVLRSSRSCIEFAISNRNFLCYLVCYAKCYDDYFIEIYELLFGYDISSIKTVCSASLYQEINESSMLFHDSLGVYDADDACNVINENTITIYTGEHFEFFLLSWAPSWFDHSPFKHTLEYRFNFFDTQDTTKVELFLEILFTNTTRKPLYLYSSDAITTVCAWFNHLQLEYISNSIYDYFSYRKYPAKFFTYTTKLHYMYFVSPNSNPLQINCKVSDFSYYLYGMIRYFTGEWVFDSENHTAVCILRNNILLSEMHTKLINYCSSDPDLTAGQLILILYYAIYGFRDLKNCEHTHKLTEVSDVNSTTSSELSGDVIVQVLKIAKSQKFSQLGYSCELLLLDKCVQKCHFTEDIQSILPLCYFGSLIEKLLN